MAEQQQLPLGNFSSQQFAPLKEAAEGAAEYTRQQGRRYRPVNPQLQVNPEVGHAVMGEYQRRQGQAPSGRTEQSYAALARETSTQHAYMTGKLGIKHEVVPEDPYKSPQDLREDVAKNKRIRTLATESTGGHPLGNHFNDQFRAVHDFFGHLSTGRGFSRHGEEAAWRSHVQMYSPAAREAMTSETRGQNSLLNYHPGRAEFPEKQELVGMPKWAQIANPSLTRLRPSQAQGQQGSLL